MRQSLFTLERTRSLTRDVYELTLSGDTSAITAPGQFVNLALPGKFLRRPVSVCDWEDNRLLLLIRAVGAGTQQLVQYMPGTELDVLSGLGNGFRLSAAVEEDRLILAGGGIGLAPLYALARIMRRQGLRPVVALGFRNAEEAFYLEEFAALGCVLAVATEDGGLGTHGSVVDLLRARPERGYVYACGPLPMLRAVDALAHLTGGQFSLEARMGCGFGVCMGCSLPMKRSCQRVCRDGPVFFREEILWQ